MTEEAVEGLVPGLYFSCINHVRNEKCMTAPVSPRSHAVSFNLLSLNDNLPTEGFSFCCNLRPDRNICHAASDVILVKT